MLFIAYSIFYLKKNRKKCLKRFWSMVKSARRSAYHCTQCYDT